MFHYAQIFVEGSSFIFHFFIVTLPHHFFVLQGIVKKIQKIDKIIKIEEERFDQFRQNIWREICRGLPCFCKIHFWKRHVRDHSSSIFLRLICQWIYCLKKGWCTINFSLCHCSHSAKITFHVKNLQLIQLKATILS